MTTKRFINGLVLAFSAVVTMLFVGCNPEHPENEKENKLHEDPVRAVFTLQEGTLNNASAFDNTPKMANLLTNCSSVEGGGMAANHRCADEYLYG